MSDSRPIILTGATSGMGLVLARNLLALPNVQILAGARSPDTATQLKGLADPARLKVLRLDLSDLESASAFSDEVITSLGPERRISAIFCNAGLQIIGPKRLTKDGVEETFAANHLGHFWLVQKLLGHMAPGGTVISTASGTHDPKDRLARLFGFRGAVFKNATAVSVGDVGDKGSVVQLGMDRYATSKLCNILFTRVMAQRTPTDAVRFMAFDPGLMPGTELARERPAPARFAWKHVLPAMQAILPGVSSPDRSARAIMRVALDADTAHRSGDYVDFNGQPARQSAAATDMRLAQDLFDVSSRLVAERG